MEFIPIKLKESTLRKESQDNVNRSKVTYKNTFSLKIQHHAKTISIHKADKDLVLDVLKVFVSC